MEQHIYMNKKGQIIVIFVFMLMSMFSFLLLVIHVSDLAREKVKLHLAADSASLSMATFQARALNAISDRNYLLKYPSGDKKMVYDPVLSKSKYEFPGIDKVDSSQYTFSSNSIFEEYIKLISPIQDQQGKFLVLYDKLIPKVCDEYIVKNDPKAFAMEKYYAPFSLRRQQISMASIDWVTGGAGEYLSKRRMIDAWYDFYDKTPIYSRVKLGKEIEIWNNKFGYTTESSSMVVPKTGSIWPEPKPSYNSRIISSGD